MRSQSSIGASAPPSASRRGAFLWWLMWVLWLPFFIPSVQVLVLAHPAPVRLVASAVGAALYFAVYLSVTWKCARYLAGPLPRSAPVGASALIEPIITLMALTLGLVALNPTGWSELFYYTASAIAGWLPTRQAVRMMFALLALLVVTNLITRATLADTAYSVVFVGVIGFAVIAIVISVTTSQRLRAEREEMAGLAAVAEERLRIARDMHDLLGRNLSLIALKSELAGRLVDPAPERAKSEIGDIERVSRKALAEVREAVASYRQPTLASELRGAREVLAAAGVAFHLEGESEGVERLPGAIEAVLSWTVREAITNVIRHSRATFCTVHMAREADAVCIEIVNDGAQMAPDHTGNGLRGLSERVAALNGRLESGLRPDGAFQLAVSLPLSGDTASKEKESKEGARA